jgi:hypothetical protein
MPLNQGDFSKIKIIKSGIKYQKSLNIWLKIGAISAINYSKLGGIKSIKMAKLNQKLFSFNHSYSGFTIKMKWYNFLPIKHRNHIHHRANHFFSKMPFTKNKKARVNAFFFQSKFIIFLLKSMSIY